MLVLQLSIAIKCVITRSGCLPTVGLEYEVSYSMFYLSLISFFAKDHSQLYRIAVK